MEAEDVLPFNKRYYRVSAPFGITASNMHRGSCVFDRREERSVIQEVSLEAELLKSIQANSQLSLMNVTNKKINPIRKLTLHNIRGESRVGIVLRVVLNLVELAL